MLRHINPLLSPDLLHCLRAMGHGDEIVIADANFPAESLGIPCLRLDGISATQTAEAILEVLPLDQFQTDRVFSMAQVDHPAQTPEIVVAFQALVDRLADHPAQICALERFDFYARAKQAYAVIQTGETRLYGNLILAKGVIMP